MTNTSRYTLKIVWVLCSLALHATRVACFAGEAPKAMTECVIPSLWPVTGSPFLGADVPSWEKQIRRWTQRSACEKLALADWLVEAMTSEEAFRPAGYEWEPGTDDLSVPAGRAKWALELVLGVKLPGNVDRHASAEYLKKLRDEAHLTVEAYRQGVMASAADHEVSPEEFARLKRKYKGKIPGGPWANGSGLAWELTMDWLLLEWPPIGRKYEDLISIIGAKGGHEEDGASFTFDLFGAHAVTYRFVLQGGVIRSLRKTTW